MLSNKENNSSSRIQFLQQNVDKNDTKMHTCLQIDLKLNIDFILFQESFVNTNTMTTISHSAYYCIMSESEEIKCSHSKLKCRNCEENHKSNSQICLFWGKQASLSISPAKSDVAMENSADFAVVIPHVRW